MALAEGRAGWPPRSPGGRWAGARAGRRSHVLVVSLHAREPAARGDDDRHGGEDDRGRDDRAHAQRLTEEQRPERDGDDRVDVGVRPDERQRRVPEQPGVRGVREHAADEDQVDEREERGGRDRLRVEARRLAGDQRLGERDRAAREHLDPRGGQRARRQLGAALRVDRAVRPAERREEEDQDPERVEAGSRRRRPAR